MSSPINRRALAGKAAWVAPAVLMATAIPAYAASSLTRPEATITVNHDPSADVYQVSVAYIFDDLSQVRQVVVRSSDPVDPNQLDTNVTASADNKTITFVNANQEGQYELLLYYIIDGPQARSQGPTYALVNDLTFDGQNLMSFSFTDLEAKVS